MKRNDHPHKSGVLLEAYVWKLLQERRAWAIELIANMLSWGNLQEKAGTGSKLASNCYKYIAATN